MQSFHKYALTSTSNTVKMTMLPRWKACVSSCRMWWFIYFSWSLKECWWFPPAARRCRLPCTWCPPPSVWWICGNEALSIVTLPSLLSSSKHSFIMTIISSRLAFSYVVLLNRSGNRFSRVSFACFSINVFSWSSSTRRMVNRNSIERHHNFKLTKVQQLS